MAFVANLIRSVVAVFRRFSRVAGRTLHPALMILG